EIGPAGGATPVSEVTVTTLDPDKIVVSASALTAGQVSVTQPAAQPFYIQALSGQGPARLRLRASGYVDTDVSVDFAPGALGFYGNPYIGPQSPGSQQQISFAYG